MGRLVLPALVSVNAVSALTAPPSMKKQDDLRTRRVAMGSVCLCKCCPGDNTTISDRWIAKAREEKVIDPERKIIDPHHHLWHPTEQPKPPITAVLKCFDCLKPASRHRLLVGAFPKPWLDVSGYTCPIMDRYMEDELINDIGGHNVVGTIYVEAGWDDERAEHYPLAKVGETVMAQGVAEQTNNRICTGIVTRSSMLLAQDLEPVLKAHMKASPNFRGLRDSLLYTADQSVMFPKPDAQPGLCRNPKFLEGLRVMAKYGVVWDTWQYYIQLDDLIEAATAVPHLTVVMDHAGSPLGVGTYKGRRAEVLAAWKEGIRRVARVPNIHCKLSGLTMPYAGFGFEEHEKPATSEELVAVLQEYYLFCIQQFGVRRCMFASNFPMDRASCSYVALYNAFKLMVKDMSEVDKNALFHDNAVRVYGLDQPPLIQTAERTAAAAEEREKAARAGTYWELSGMAQPPGPGPEPGPGPAVGVGVGVAKAAAERTTEVEEKDADTI